VNLDKIRAERHNKIAMLLRYFGAIMAIFYFVMGLGFMVLPWFAQLEEIRYAVGVMLILYSIFRTYRLIKNLKQHD
jgi:Kef-type K+ transport system membrane component KefB